MPDLPNGLVEYIGGTLSDNGCYERDTFARNKCDGGFRVIGPSSRACSGVFDDNVLVSVRWVPNAPVTCVRKFIVSACIG